MHGATLFQRYPHHPAHPRRPPGCGRRIPPVCCSVWRYWGVCCAPKDRRSVGRPLAEATAHPPEPDRAPAETKKSSAGPSLRQPAGRYPHHAGPVARPRPIHPAAGAVLTARFTPAAAVDLITICWSAEPTRGASALSRAEARFHCRHPIPRLMSRVFSFVEPHRTTGVTRADVRADSPLAQTMAHKAREFAKDACGDPA